MVIDAAKGVEDRTRKLMEVTRLRDTPILTFMNKLDRDIRDPMEVMDEVERELKIACSPITRRSAAASCSRVFTTCTRMKPTCIRPVKATPSVKCASSKARQPGAGCGGG